MILLFGAAGQLGREITAAAAQAGLPLVARGHQAIDIADEEAVIGAVTEIRPALIVNAAAYAKVDLAEREPSEAWRTNASGPGILARAAAAADIPIVHISTDHVFDGLAARPYRESDATNPLSVYGKSKAAGETAVRHRAPRHIILRTAWLFGMHGTNFVKTIMRLAAEPDDLRVVADQIGSPTAAEDVARAIVAIAPRLTAAGAAWGTYHVAGRGITSRHGFAERVVAKLAERTGRVTRVAPIRTVDYPLPATRPMNSALDSTKFEAEFGIRLPQWQDAVDRVVIQILADGGTI